MTAPARIVSLISSATEMLYGLGLGGQVAGVSHECDYPAEVRNKPRVTRSRIESDAGSLAIDEQVRAMFAAGEPLYEIDAARLVALRPDLIVTQAQCDVCAVRYQDVLDLVAREPSLRAAAVVALQPDRLQDIFADIRRLGEAANRAAAAEAYIASLQRRVDCVRACGERIPSAIRPRVAMIEWTEPLMLAGNWNPELVELAGGRHDLTRAGMHSPYVSWGDLQAYNPEVIVVAPCGFDLKRTLEELAPLVSNPAWANLSAVRNGQVWAIDGNAYFNRSGPRIVDSLEILAHAIHPNKFPAPKWLEPGAMQRV